MSKRGQRGSNQRRGRTSGSPAPARHGPPGGKSGPTGLSKRLSDHPHVALLLALAAVVGAVGTLITPVRSLVGVLADARSDSSSAEEGRLAELTAGVTLASFEDTLDGDRPELRRPLPEGLTRHVYQREEVYVLAVTDPTDTVVSFAVMLRVRDFHPEIDGIVLGETPPAEAWATPGALGGGCGRPVEYFEVSPGPSSATPTTRSLGLSAVGSHADEDLVPICSAETALSDCDALVYGDGALSRTAADCFLTASSGQDLRRGLRPNVYAEGAPYQELTYEMVTIFESEILALTE